MAHSSVKQFIRDGTRKWCELQSLRLMIQNIQTIAAVSARLMIQNVEKTGSMSQSTFVINHLA